MQASSFFVAPHKTPRIIKILIWVIVTTSLVFPILTFGFNHYFQMPGPSQWFVLSRWGLSQGWIWELFTYSFLHSPGVAISLSLLVSILFHMFLLWFAGSEVSFRFGTRPFLAFFFGGALFAGLISAGALFLFSSQAVVVGSSPPIYALLMIWAMIYPEMELYFFFMIRVKAKWLVAIFLGIALILSLSNQQFIPFLADFSGIVWGFLIGRLGWKLPNPYPLNLQRPRRKKRTDSAGKIIDISVIHERDEAFMDRMLDKIHRKGEDALTKRERDRMNKIARKK